jgi:hypothetical protein
VGAFTEYLISSWHYSHLSSTLFIKYERMLVQYFKEKVETKFKESSTKVDFNMTGAKRARAFSLGIDA